MQTIGAVLAAILDTFVEMAPYLLLGLTFAGLLHILFKKEFILRHLGHGNFASVVKAAVLGVPLPLCSCGVVPTALSLRRSKASDGATVSFLISTPQTGIDSIVATYGLLGPVFAIFRPLAAFIMGIGGGVITNVLLPGKHAKQEDTATTSANCVVCSKPAGHPHTVFEKAGAMIRYAYSEFLDDISVQLIVGIVISGLISFFLPPDFFGRYVGNEFLAMALMIVGGIPLYVCATASIPIAVALMMKGLSPGAAFVFLAVGPATNAATVTLIASVMGKKIVAIYLAVIAVLSVLAGVALNALYRIADLGSPITHLGHHHHETTSPWVFGLAAVFGVMLLLSLIRKFMPGLWRIVFPNAQPATCATTLTDAAQVALAPRVVKVEGMTCHKCARYVTESIQTVEGVQSVHVDLEGKQATVTGDFDVEKVKKAVEDAGYKTQ